MEGVTQMRVRGDEIARRVWITFAQILREYVDNANRGIIPCDKHWKSSIEMVVWLAIHNILRASTQIRSNDNFMNLRYLHTPEILRGWTWNVQAAGSDWQPYENIEVKILKVPKKRLEWRESLTAGERKLICSLMRMLRGAKRSQLQDGGISPWRCFVETPPTAAPARSLTPSGSDRCTPLPTVVERPKRLLNHNARKPNLLTLCLHFGFLQFFKNP